MKGYFSQLAHHTGLSFEIGRVSPDGSTARTVPALHGEVRPLHLEEVTFTNASLPPVHGVSGKREDAAAARTRIEPISGNEDEKVAGPADDARIRQSEFTEINSEIDAKAAPHASIEIPSGPVFEAPMTQLPGSGSIAAKSPERMPDKQSIEIEDQAILISDEPLTAGPSEQRLGTPVQLERQVEMPPTERGERRDSELQGQRREAELQIQQEVIVRDYLKEVRDWVSTPLEMGESEADFAVRVETRQENKGLSGPDYQTDVPQPSRHSRYEEPEAQELNLSIGTISVVIEEPERQAPVSQVVSPRTERSAERTTAESTDLSRYYLRSW